jgi:serine/threonine-protein kinase ULK/ATG1
MKTIETINKKYTIDLSQCLGKGAYSKVFVGYDDGIKVAIKYISKKDMTPKLIQRLEQEINIMKLLKCNPHPNIVQCLDVVEKNQDMYIIMEYCDSGDLSVLLKKPIKEKYVQFYMCQLNHGLKFLDKMKIFHRDIKPKNILLTRNRKILKIADFGFAKVVEEENLIFNTLCGSPLYMAPEIMKKNASSTKTDLWSIGMIIYEMLFGIHPFKNTNNIFDLMYAIETQEIIIPPPNTINNKLSPECLHLLNCLLKKNENIRLSWDNFFTHSWLNKYIIEYDDNYKVKNNEENNNKIQDSLLQNINTSLVTLVNEKIELIENYMS